MKRSRWLGPTGSLVLGATLATQPLAAQEPTDTVAIEELVVTATRLAVPAAAVSSAVTVLRGAELREQGVTHVIDAIRALPGLSVVQNGPPGATASLFVRGGESDYVQVLVDGVPINEPGGRADLASLTTDNIERIEVVRGPASVLYGSDAVSGVIQIFTRTGGERTRASASVRGGSYGTLAYDAELSGAAGPVSYAIAASRYGTDGVYEINNEYRNDVLSGRVHYRPDALTEINATVRYGDARYHYPTDGAGNVVDSNAYQDDQRLVLGLELARRLTDRFEARLLLSASELDALTHDAQDNAADTLGSWAYRSVSDIRRRAAELRANYNLADRGVLTAGVELEAQSLDNESESDGEWGPSSDAFNAERTNHGYYTQLLLEPAGNLYLTLGARLDDNEAFGSFETYRAGIAYALPTGTRLRGAFGTAFKEPTFHENYSEGYSRGNPDLHPERSRSWEVGIEQSVRDGRITLAATYFDQRFRDMIQYRTVPVESNEPNYENIARADVSGIELEATLAPLPGLAARLGYTRLDSEVVDAGFQEGPDAEFVNGQRLIRRPDHSARLDMRYALGSRGAFDLGVRYVGGRDDLDFSEWPSKRVQLPAYTLVDLGTELRLVPAADRRPAITAMLRVENLLDESYQEIVHFRTRGRALTVGVRVGTGG